MCIGYIHGERGFMIAVSEVRLPSDLRPLYVCGNWFKKKKYDLIHYFFSFPTCFSNIISWKPLENTLYIIPSRIGCAPLLEWNTTARFSISISSESELIECYGEEPKKSSL